MALTATSFVSPEGAAVGTGGFEGPTVKKCRRVPPLWLQLQDIFGRTALPPFFVVLVGEELWQMDFSLELTRCRAAAVGEDWRLSTTILKVYGIYGEGIVWIANPQSPL